jgi:hypothetical protein
MKAMQVGDHRIVKVDPDDWWRLATRVTGEERRIATAA